MAFKLLDSSTIARILSALHPRFIGRDQDHLLTLADESGAIAYEAAQTYVQPLYDFRDDIESTAGAGLVGVNDAGGYYTGVTVEEVLQQLPAKFLSSATTYVSSFNGRAGAVNPAANDYAFSQIASVPGSLTALGTTSWSVDSIAVGNGANSVGQVSFAANTFPAKASTGALVAKPITDFGLSLVDDATAAAGRTTLGMADGTFAPVVSLVANLTAGTVDKFIYARVGNTVMFSAQLSVTATAASTTTSLRLSMPVASAFANNEDCSGTVCVGNSGGGFIRADPATDTIFIQFPSTGTGSLGVRITGLYQVI